MKKQTELNISNKLIKALEEEVLLLKEIISTKNEIIELQKMQLLLNGVSKSLQHAGYLFNGRFYKTYDDLRGKTMNEENKPIPVYFSNDC